jgi:type IV pilus assembly protein PilM
MAAIQPGVWGIDLGQCALKALRLENVDGQLTATAFDYVEHPKILSQPDADPDQLTREALEKFLSRNTLRGDIVAISVPGQSGLARFVKLPPVEEKKIVDIVKFEAKQQIPFNLDEVVWDYQKIGAGVVTDGFAMETEIGLFAMKRDMVSRYLQHFQDVNVEVHIVQMAPLSLCNYVSFDLLGKGTEKAEGGDEGAGKKQCIVALDIGADSSNLVITDGERIIWQRPIPLGGNHFTRALTKDLKLTFAKAEHVKRNATKSPDLKKILASLKPVLNDFVGEVQRSLGYFTNTHRDAQVLYMVGLGNAFRLPGLQKFLSEKLQLDVRRLQKLERLAGDPVITAPAFVENVPTFAVAFGLALQGLKLPKLQTNLLPQEIQVARMVRAKKPWAAAAAAALLLGVGGLSLSYALEYRAIAGGDSPIGSAIKESEAVTKDASAKTAAVDSAEKKFKEEVEAVQSIIAGQEERLNWLALNKFISDVVPRPDGSNLSPTARNKYWSQKAKTAFDKMREEQASGKVAGTVDKSKEDLIQVNLEGVSTRYTDSLTAFWDRLRADRDLFNTMIVMPSEQKAKAPDGKGWVIELRGYTYHQGANFINDTLMDNIVRIGKVRVAPAGDAAGAGGAAGTVGATGATGASDKPATNEGPVIGSVSHVVMIKTLYLKDGDPFDLVNNGVLTTYVVQKPAEGGGGGDGGSGPAAANMGSAFGGKGSGGMGGMMGGGGGTGRDAWTELGSVGGASAPTSGGGGTPPSGGAPATYGAGSGRGGFNAGSAGFNAGSAGSARPPALGTGAPGTGAPGGAATTGSGTPAKGTGLKRTEFIVLFCWKEPTPSDKLMPEPPPPETGGGAGGMGGFGKGGMGGAGGGGGAGAGGLGQP